ncbi:MAG: hypothetical protein K9W46_09875 [Candidatus Heimdallarchaeum endolithica]|uniref:Uncharacterized protein n=1 Tax=Candidatus Heimdallarchaeum endolithica TaxID=2876572 RepID=A0A9Y1FNH7_9ARCH|nr:MAG: hypothetical protein K9W46_09875 [Candidatus Heimdallarchaeum endolithica]
MKLTGFLRSIFRGKEKDFMEKFYKMLSEKRYVNLARIETKLSYTQRVELVNKLLADNLISGIFLPEKKYFFSFDKKMLEETEQRFKQSGKLDAQKLKKQWSINEKLLKFVLQKFGKGFLGYTYYYSYDYVYSLLKNNLVKCEDEFSLKNLSSELGLDEEIIIKLTKTLLNESEVRGAIKGNSLFLSEKKTFELIMEIIEEQSENTFEIAFDDISKVADIPITFIEPILFKIVQENPDRFTLYPIDKKILIKN